MEEVHTCGGLQNTNPNQPLQGRIALTADPTAMRVTWTSLAS
jgi:hypothetical protein